MVDYSYMPNAWHNDFYDYAPIHPVANSYHVHILQCHISQTSCNHSYRNLFENFGGNVQSTAVVQIRKRGGECNFDFTPSRTESLNSASACRASSASVKVTNPKPREVLVFGSRTTVACLRGYDWEKCSVNRSVVTETGRDRTNNDCLFSSSLPAGVLSGAGSSPSFESLRRFVAGSMFEQLRCIE